MWASLYAVRTSPTSHLRLLQRACRRHVCASSMSESVDEQDLQSKQELEKATQVTNILQTH